MRISVANGQLCIDGKPLGPVAEISPLLSVQGQKVFYQGQEVGTVSEYRSALTGVPERMQILRNRIEAIRSAFSFKPKYGPTPGTTGRSTN